MHTSYKNLINNIFPLEPFKQEEIKRIRLVLQSLVNCRLKAFNSGNIARVGCHGINFCYLFCGRRKNVLCINVEI